MNVHLADYEFFFLILHTRVSSFPNEAYFNQLVHFIFVVSNLCDRTKLRAVK